MTAGTDKAAPAPFDEEQAQRLALRVAGGEAHAFAALQEEIWLEVLSLASRSRRLRSSDEDGPQEVSVRVIEKLVREDYRALRTYATWQERHPDKSFHDWLRIVTANTMRDFLRASRRESREHEPSAIRLLNEFTVGCSIDAIGLRPQMTPAQTARELLEYAVSRLDEDQWSALERWLRGEANAEIAAAMGLGHGEAASKLVRAGVARLRRQFAGG